MARLIFLFLFFLGKSAVFVANLLFPWQSCTICSKCAIVVASLKSLWQVCSCRGKSAVFVVITDLLFEADYQDGKSAILSYLKSILQDTTVQLIMVSIEPSKVFAFSFSEGRGFY